MSGPDLSRRDVVLETLAALMTIAVVVGLVAGGLMWIIDRSGI